MRNKIKQYEILIKDPFVAGHLPETYWFHNKSLLNMLNKHQVIYLKPNDNTGGNGVIRVRSMSNGLYSISFDKTTKQVNVSNISATLRQIMIWPQKYIIQQGIDLATYKGKPFDMRIVLQKVLKTWRVTLTSAKVANAQDAVVTNVAKGAEDFPLHKILQEYDQKQEPIVAFREIIDLSHQIASILGTQQPIGIAGLDIALDKRGKVWFIESNERPECSRCKLVNDPISVKKYEDARNILKLSKR